MSENVYKDAPGLKKYQFAIFDEDKKSGRKVSHYEIKKLTSESKSENFDQTSSVIDEQIYKKDYFELSSIITKFQGAKTHERRDLEKKIESELYSKLKNIREEAYQKGYEEGKAQGLNEIQKSVTMEAEKKIEQMEILIKEVLSLRAGIISSQKKQVYELLCSLTKWIVLRELKDDGEYINRLLEKLILELDSKVNIIVKVNDQYFKQIPEALDTIQKNIGKLSNVRIITEKDLSEGPGLIVETENGIINGDLPVQLENLNKIFDTVIQNEG